MAYRGTTIPKVGRALIAKRLATQTPIKLVQIMVGSGICPDDVPPEDLTGLLNPVAEATSTIPTYKGSAVYMTVEYRSDLNGGLEEDFSLSEFAIYAEDDDGSKVMVLYGCLGAYEALPVKAYDGKAADVRRFPVVLSVGSGGKVTVDYYMGAYLTAEELEEYSLTVLLPQFMEQVDEKIAVHNADKTAHSYILSLIDAMASRLNLLELILNTNVSGNQFSVTFESLSGKTVEGVWNKAQARIEF